MSVECVSLEIVFSEQKFKSFLGNYHVIIHFHSAYGAIASNHLRFYLIILDSDFCAISSLFLRVIN